MTNADSLQRWRELSLPRVDVGDWDSSTALLGLREIERLRRALDGAQAVLVGLVQSTVGRDTKALLQQELQMSRSEAVHAQQVAEVAGRVACVSDALADGLVNAQHVRALRNVSDADAAALLLADAVAGRLSPEEFVKKVDRYRIDANPEEWKQRQVRMRSVTFFQADHQMIGIRALLPTVDGACVKAALHEIVNSARRAQELDDVKAPSADSYEQALADALVAGLTGAAPPHQSGSESAESESAEQGARAGGAGSGRTAVVVVIREQDRPAPAARAGSSSSGPTSPKQVGPETNETCCVDSESVDSESVGRKRVGRERVGTVDFAPEAVDKPGVLDNQHQTGPVDREWVAEVVGVGPIPLAEAVRLSEESLLSRARVDLYGAVESADGSILKFGRSRRLASAIQRLALVVGDRGCVVAGCTADWQFCDSDHVTEWESGGTTDLENLRLLCHQHHTFRHQTDTGLRLRIQGQQQPPRSHAKTSAVSKAPSGPSNSARRRIRAARSVNRQSPQPTST